MITKESTARHFIHNTVKNKDGTPLRARRNGVTKTWKRMPQRFCIPIKHGLYDYGYITNDNAHEWSEA